jgi:formylglycine-generating enzyme required for sulfatase activity
MLLPVVCFCLHNDLIAQVPGLVPEKPATGPSVQTDRGWMIPYDAVIPGSDITFRMMPIPGGKFRMGSSADESGHQADEAPVREFQVEPFWMAECEVTWDQYKPFMSLYRVFKGLVSENRRVVTDANRIDAVTAPTPLYEPDFTFEFGEDPRQPAVSMTQYAAKQFTKWVSLSSGQNYRLPTEAEWEYACRANTATAWYFGNDLKQLPEHAWFADNSGGKGTHPVRALQPNPWGLYDMHGNVAEWVLDGYGTYPSSSSAEIPLASRDWVRSDKPYPRVVRGGSWEFPAAQCRSASRLGSDDKAWKEYDPNLPNSPWWFTTDPARGVGFRLIRPLSDVSREAMEEFWKIDCEDTQYDVQDRLNEGRGVLGLVDPELPAAIREFSK